ncbi:MAG: alpha-glucuronidase family glycosyl hydrolase [Bacteroidota bacterium]
MPKSLSTILLLVGVIATVNFADADDGHGLWLKYDLTSDPQLLKEYKISICVSMVKGKSPTIQAARNELQNGINGLLGSTIPQVNHVNKTGSS